MEIDETIIAPELPVVLRTGDELAMLRSYIAFYRAVLVRKCAGLSREQLHRRREPSTMSLGGLLFHSGLVEDWWCTHRIAGLAVPEPWAHADWDADRDWEWTLAATLGPQEIDAQFAESVARSQAVLDAVTSADQLAAGVDDKGQGCSVRWVLLHLLEEYARHCGHADLLREWIDGASGD